jgi:hypothetical protein
MSKARGQGNTLWIAIAIAAVLVALVVLAATMVRLPKPATGNPANPPTSSVNIARADPKGGDIALMQQVELYDPKPLFLPTAINNSDPELPAGLRREPGAAFRSFLPQYAFDEYDMKKVTFAEPVRVPDDPVQALSVGKVPNPFYAFGRINYPYKPLAARQAFIEVQQTKTGRTVLAFPVSADQSERLPAVDWKPLEMLIAIEAAGLVGEPTVVTSSDFEAVDNYFRMYVAKQFRLGARLAPGVYALRIGL